VSILLSFDQARAAGPRGGSQLPEHRKHLETHISFDCSVTGSTSRFRTESTGQSERQRALMPRPSFDPGSPKATAISDRTVLPRIATIRAPIPTKTPGPIVDS